MTRIRILSIELEGPLAETLPLVRDALAGAPTSTRELVALEAPTLRALPAVHQESVPVEPPAPRRATSKPGPRKGKATKAAPAAEAPTGGRTAQAAEIRRRISVGESNAVIAEAVGVSEAGVQYHRKKMAPGNGKTSGKGSPKGALTIRCQECGQMGYDPKRCDHCQEKR